MVVGETPEKRQNQSARQLSVDKTGVTHLITDGRRSSPEAKADGQGKQLESRLAGKSFIEPEIQIPKHVFVFN